MAPPINASGMEFEVFLSFRGPDTRDNFTSCLYSDMVEKGIRVFKDDEELRVGQKIGGNLLRALDDTQIYIPIFSKGFASSPWCLREIAHMVDCTSKSDGKKEILPVFFDVEPDDVKLKTELYRDALSEHEKKYSSDEVKRWGDALVEVPTRVGWKLGGKGYGELIKLIVRELLLKLKAKNRDIPDHLVETDDLKLIEKLLDVDSNDHVRFLVIHGVGGIGKSTLASVIFNRFRSKFNCCSFLDDVPRQGLSDVQKKLLSDTLGSASADEIHGSIDGIDRIRRGLSNKKVLVVLDNVDEKRQLENLAGRCDWFGPGSRVIITVRDKSTILDKGNQTIPCSYYSYEMKEMPTVQAVKLFSKHAFRSNTPPEGCYDFSEDVVSSIGRLPLTLEVVGALFANKVRSEWDETLEELKQVPHKDVRKALITSINQLDAIEKAIFLDIACFCIGEDNTYADCMWRSIEGYSPRSAIDVLLLMSLIKIDDSNRFWMHDEVRDLGRYIVKEENIEDVGNRRWVRIDENNLDLLRSNKKKRAVRALSLGVSHDLTPEELVRLPMLRFLRGRGLNFVGDFKNLHLNLRWLSWLDCPLDSSALNLHLVNLVVLNLSGSNITDEWSGWRQIKMAKKLKILDLTKCYLLTKTPDFSEFGKLEKLILANCWRLSKIDSSISNLKLLTALNIEGCMSLEELPEEIGSLERLSEIIMPSRARLFKFSDTLGSVKSLRKFEIPRTGIIQLPHSIGRLNLTHLDLCCCNNLHELPDSIGEVKSLIMLDLSFSKISTLPDSIRRLKSLKHLLLKGCKNLLELPDSIGELEALVKLKLNYSGISILPHSIGRLRSLKHLLLKDCENLLELRDSIGELEALVELKLHFSRISVLPDSIGMLKSLKHLFLQGCKNLLELPESIGELEALVELNLNYSGIFVLPDSIGMLKSLKHLLLQGCENLLELPESIGELEALVELNLNYSGIFVLPDSIGRLKNPKHLHLYCCQNLHERLDFESLVKLKLNSWGISTVPHFMVRLTRLTHLSLSECENLRELPDSIGQMELLVELDLKSSGITLLPNSIGNLKRLKVLNVACTNIRTIPRALGGVETLEELDASFCPHLVDEIPWEMWSLTRLRILDLYGSPISMVPRKISGFSSLQTLKIASDRLYPLPELPLSLECLEVAASEFPVLPDLSCLVHLHHLEVRRKHSYLSFFSPQELTSPWKDPQFIDQLPPSLSTLKLHSIPRLPEISDFQNLSVLSISECPTPRLPDLSRLKWLQELRLSHFPELVEIPGLGELEWLRFLHITRCDVIEQLPNLSKLRNLLWLELKHCAKLRAVQGLKELKNLMNAVIRGCMSLQTDWTPLEEPAEHAIRPAKRLQLSLD